MPRYQIKVLREETVVIEAPDTEAAALVAKAMVADDPTLKLLGVVRLDLLEPITPPKEAA